MKREDVKNWFSERLLENRDYQVDIIHSGIDNNFFWKKEVVLAACPSSGKTLISICYLDFYLKQNPTHKVLILTHGTTILRSQYYENIVKFKPHFTYNVVEKGNDILSSEEQVIITLPQTIYRIENKPTFDLLIIDEGHQFYFAEDKGMDGMVMNIKKQCKIKKTLILTGTPSPFIYRNYRIIPITVEKLLEYGSITDVRVEIGTSAYNFTFKDYNQVFELKNEAKFYQKDTTITLDKVLDCVVNKLKSVFKNKPEIYSSLLTNVGWSFPLRTLKKTMIVCRSIEQAYQVQSYFINKDINAVLSTSDNDYNSTEISNFTKDDNILVLIVVARGILGFDYPELVNVIDMSCSQNIDRIFQLLCRVIRKHPNNDQKLFFKIVPSHLEQYFEHLMSAVMCLTNEEYYTKYNGKNFMEMPIPTFEYVKKTTIRKKKETDNKDEKEKPIKPKLKLWDIPSIKFFNSLIHKNNEILNTVYWTTLKKVKEEFSDRDWYAVLTDDELIERLKNECNERGYTTFKEIYRSDLQSSYNVLKKRKLSRKFCEMMNWEFGRDNDLKKLTDDELLQHLKFICIKKGYNMISDISYKEGYYELKKRNLSESFSCLMNWNIKKKHDIWDEKISKEELFEKLKNIVFEKELYPRLFELSNFSESSGGYEILKKRNLKKEFKTYLKNYLKNTSTEKLDDDVQQDVQVQDAAQEIVVKKIEPKVKKIEPKKYKFKKRNFIVMTIIKNPSDQKAQVSVGSNRVLRNKQYISFLIKRSIKMNENGVDFILHLNEVSFKKYKCTKPYLISRFPDIIISDDLED